MKTLFLSIITALSLSACGSLNFSGTFANRVSCTVAKDEAYVVSKYGSFGISSTIDQKDTAVICK